MIKRDDKKMTAKQWAIDMLLGDIELATDYYYERYETEWNRMTQKEQDAVCRQVNVFHDRFLVILKKAKGAKSKGGR